MRKSCRFTFWPPNLEGAGVWTNAPGSGLAGVWKAGKDMLPWSQPCLPGVVVKWGGLCILRRLHQKLLSEIKNRLVVYVVVMLVVLMELASGPNIISWELRRSSRRSS